MRTSERRLASADFTKPHPLWGNRKQKLAYGPDSVKSYNFDIDPSGSTDLTSSRFGPEERLLIIIISSSSSIHFQVWIQTREVAFLITQGLFILPAK